MNLNFIDDPMKTRKLVLTQINERTIGRFIVKRDSGIFFES